MTKRSTNNKITSNTNNKTTSNTNNKTTSNTNNGFDWTTPIAQATFEGGQAFLKIIGNTAPDVTDAQLETDEQQMDRWYARSLDYAMQERTDVSFNAREESGLSPLSPLVNVFRLVEKVCL